MSLPYREIIDFDNLEPEYFADLDEEKYHNLEAVGSTDLRAADTSIREFIDTRERDFETDEMRQGSACHIALLEPERFKRILSMRPPERPNSSRGWYDKHKQTASLRINGDCADGHECKGETHEWECVAERKTKAGTTPEKCKEYGRLDGFDALVDYYAQDGITFPLDVEIPSAEMIEKAKRTRDAVLEHPVIENGLLDDAKTETSFRWTERPRDYAIKCKGRTDLEIRLDDGTSYLGDLKARRRSPSPYSFRKSVGNYKSHVQAAHYCRGYEIATGREVRGYFYIGAQYERPNHVYIYELDSTALKAGVERALNALTTISSYLENPDQFTGPSAEIINLELKPWEL